MARQRPSEVPETRRASSADSILDAAESLFGRHGTEGVSLRQIGVAAGSSNHSAVQYHFNDRDGLIRGIFARRLPSLERARAQRLEQALQSGLGGDTGALLGALLLPIAGERDSAGQCSFAAFLLGLRLFGDITQWRDYAESATVTRDLEARLRASAPGTPKSVFSSRLLSAVSVFLIAVVDWERGVAGGANRTDAGREDYLESILAFATAGLLAPH